jgi:hypothetical protein
MSDEKRPTRLLTFRLRRDGAARRAAHRAAADFSGDAEDFSGDAELSALLRAWEAPTPSADARGRLLSDFRASARPAPLWRRALSADVRVPLPVAACAAVALLASLFALAARTQTPAPAATTHNAPAETRAAEPTPTVKILEVPVERERVVTRFVYVEKSARAEESQQLAASRQPTAARRSLATRAAVAQSDSNGEAAGGVRTAIDSGTQSAGEPTSYFTRVDMADFQPAEKMELRIVKRGKTDEK